MRVPIRGPGCKGRTNAKVHAVIRLRFAACQNMPPATNDGASPMVREHRRPAFLLLQVLQLFHLRPPRGGHSRPRTRWTVVRPFGSTASPRAQHGAALMKVRAHAVDGHVV